MTEDFRRIMSLRSQKLDGSPGCLEACDEDVSDTDLIGGIPYGIESRLIRLLSNDVLSKSISNPGRRSSALPIIFMRFAFLLRSGATHRPLFEGDSQSVSSRSSKFLVINCIVCLSGSRLGNLKIVDLDAYALRSCYDFVKLRHRDPKVALAFKP